MHYERLNKNVDGPELDRYIIGKRSHRKCPKGNGGNSIEASTVSKDEHMTSHKTALKIHTEAIAVYSGAEEKFVCDAVQRKELK